MKIGTRLTLLLTLPLIGLMILFGYLSQRIDFLCEVTGESSCSGATAAHRGFTHRYDLMVECSQLEIGGCCLALALSWIQGAIHGHPLGSVQREVLAALRWIYRGGSSVAVSTRLAGALGRSVHRAESTLVALQDAGYLLVVPYAVNLSGITQYRLRAAGPTPLQGNGGPDSLV